MFCLSWPKMKKTKSDEDQKRRWPKNEDNQKQRRPKRKMTNNEDDQKRRWPKTKMPKNKDDPKWRRGDSVRPELTQVYPGLFPSQSDLLNQSAQRADWLKRRISFNLNTRSNEQRPIYWARDSLYSVHSIWIEPSIVILIFKQFPQKGKLLQ